MSTKTFNFANASMATWGLYVVYTGVAFYGGSPYQYLLFAFLFGGLLGAIWYVTVNRRLLRRGASETVLMMSTLGYELILLSAAQMYADILTGPPFLMSSHGLAPRYINFEGWLWDPKISGLDALPVILVMSGIVAITAILLALLRRRAKLITRTNAITIFILFLAFEAVITVLLILGTTLITVVSLTMAMSILVTLHLILVKTKFGVAIRATVENPQLADIGGINSDRVYLTSWIIGGGLASLGGAVVAFTSGIAGPELGWTIIVPMFAASILGGLYSIYGGILGGYVVGLAEYLVINALSLSLGGWILAYRPVIPLVIMVVVLLFAPQGIAGLQWISIRKRVLNLGKGITKVSTESTAKRDKNVT
jgi:branched-subunit amino acid ABC-type transport system permease component